MVNFKGEEAIAFPEEVALKVPQLLRYLALCFAILTLTSLLLIRCSQKDKSSSNAIKEEEITQAPNQIGTVESSQLMSSVQESFSCNKSSVEDYVRGNDLI